MKVKKATNNIVGDLQKQLQKEDLYSADKDALMLNLLDNAYTIYQEALEDISINGAVLDQYDDNEHIRHVMSPNYRIYLDMHKEIVKCLSAMYLTPLSRKLIADNLDIASKDNPITKMIQSLKEIDKKK